MHSLRKLLIGAGLCAFATGCGSAVTTADVQAIFDAKCVQCHGAATPAAGLSLNDFHAKTVGVKSNQDTGKDLISAGSSANSYLYAKIKGENIASMTQKMPPMGAAELTQAEIDDIGAYIDDGATK